jgi:pimeloyl-ACP methyl ester carboxylesterase
MRAYNPRLSPDFSLHLARHGTRRSERGDGYVWKFDPLHRTRTPQPFYLEQARAFWLRVTSPALIVRGGESPFRWDPSERRECMTRARTQTVPDAGHMVHHDQPENLARVIRKFLRENLKGNARSGAKRNRAATP